MTPPRPTPAPVEGIGLDHVGLIVPDLAAARTLWQALGFTLTARADHTRTGPDGQRVPAGSSQHSVMLDEGYIELMQITDPHAGHPLTAAMQQRYGLHILALATDTPEATHEALRARGVALSAVMDWSRTIAEGPVQGLARFRFFDTPWRPEDASYVCWVQHLTPALVRPPSTLQHVNGARALRGLRYAGSALTCQAWIQRLVDLGLAAPDPATAPLAFALGPAHLEEGTEGGAASVRPTTLTLAFDALPEWLARVRACGLQPLPAGPGREGAVIVDLGPACPIRIEAIDAKLSPPWLLPRP